MYNEEMLRQQLLDDLETLHELILRYAAGDRSVRQRRDELDGAIRIKLAFWRAMASQDPRP